MIVHIIYNRKKGCKTVFSPSYIYIEIIESRSKEFTMSFWSFCFQVHSNVHGPDFIWSPVVCDRNHMLRFERHWYCLTLASFSQNLNI